MSAIPADAEERFQQFLEHTVPYYAVVEAAGDEPWHGGNVERRRELFFRKWQRPTPPNLPVPKSLKEINAPMNNHTEDDA